MARKMATAKFLASVQILVDFCKTAFSPLPVAVITTDGNYSLLNIRTVSAKNQLML
jgi:hypothetical protein